MTPIQHTAQANGKTEPSCYLCGSSNIGIKFPSTHDSHNTDADSYRCTSFGHSKHGEIVKCRDCGLTALKEIPGRLELEQIYKQVVDPLYIEERESRNDTFKNVVKSVQMYAAGGKLLDVGGYCGYFLDAASEAGFDAQGVELSEWACAESRRRGHRVHNGSLSSLDMNGYFDAVTMWDVIEHFSDPGAELAEVNRLLKKGGYFFLSTINIGSAAARLTGRRWPWLMDMHIFYFDKRTITGILEDHGFSVVQIRNYTHYVSSKYLIKKFAHIAKPAELVLKALQGIFGEFKVPFNLGDNMMVIARKL